MFFYEYTEHKPLKGGPKYPTGAQGIVRVVAVSGPIYRRDTVIEYADGTVKYWSWGVPTADEDTDGFVALDDVLNVRGYKAGNYLHGFNHGTGVKKLDDEQAHALMKLFKAGARNRQRTGVAT